MKKLSKILLLGAFILNAVGCSDYRASDEHIRKSVVLIKGINNQGSCTGVQVRAPKSKKVYILTARHCKEIFNDKKEARGIIEVAGVGKVKIVAISQKTDLMLLTAVDESVIRVADELVIHEHIRTITHGMALKAHKSEGEIIQRTVENLEGQMVKLFIMTAFVRPGSSGGPVVNDKGELVGIASATNFFMVLSFAVPLEDIQEFLKDK